VVVTTSTEDVEDSPRGRNNNTSNSNNGSNNNSNRRYVRNNDASAATADRDKDKDKEAGGERSKALEPAPAASMLLKINPVVNQPKPQNPRKAEATETDDAGPDQRRSGTSRPARKGPAEGPAPAPAPAAAPSLPPPPPVIAREDGHPSRSSRSRLTTTHVSLFLKHLLYLYVHIQGRQRSCDQASGPQRGGVGTVLEERAEDAW
jgi:hypothetical protein